MPVDRLIKEAEKISSICLSFAEETETYNHGPRLNEGFVSLCLSYLAHSRPHPGNKESPFTDIEHGAVQDNIIHRRQAVDEEGYGNVSVDGRGPTIFTSYGH